MLAGCKTFNIDKKHKANYGYNQYYFKPLFLLNNIYTKGNKIDFRKPVQYRLYSKSSDALLKDISLFEYYKVINHYHAHIKITSNYYLNSNSGYEKWQTTPSFQVDYNESAFKPIVEEMITIYGKTPTISQIKDFTYKYIKNKKSSGQFSFASTIATQKTGTCKEHAVFSTAIARAFRYPARVIFGYVMVESKKTNVVRVAGHAWAEVYDKEEEKWTKFDATKLKPVVDNSYLPVVVFHDHKFSYFQAFKTLQYLHRIDIVF